tara:strand:- start:1256 stop:1573 length:318 start_codon:yes stop_codon:yes gene_type:complete
MSRPGKITCGLFFAATGRQGIKGNNPAFEKNSICKNAPNILDNYGACGGVGAHSTAIRRRLRGVGNPQNIPLCQEGQSAIDSTGKRICKIEVLPRKFALNQVYGS